MYDASKMPVEKAAWKLNFSNEHKKQCKFYLVTLNPPLVHGQFLHKVAQSEDLNVSMLDWFNTVVKSTKSNEEQASI